MRTLTCPFLQLRLKLAAAKQGQTPILQNEPFNSSSSSHKEKQKEKRKRKQKETIKSKTKTKSKPKPKFGSPPTKSKVIDKDGSNVKDKGSENISEGSLGDDLRKRRFPENGFDKRGIPDEDNLLSGMGSGMGLGMNTGALALSSGLGLDLGPGLGPRGIGGTDADISIEGGSGGKGCGGVQR
ncbi:uncharacterized protein IL334_004732 [Kwoniella shivajii]|uniref:Uncharacterized protein n=1 Tax=Kwoniella shivajii TaxID=564305 RepID=A0ABZ1D2X1_9TREE|nr:hypothetical protein IL334_004732 [Kwoniella shivajii]